MYYTPLIDDLAFTNYTGQMHRFRALLLLHLQLWLDFGRNPATPEPTIDGGTLSNGKRPV